MQKVLTQWYQWYISNFKNKKKKLRRNYSLYVIKTISKISILSTAIFLYLLPSPSPGFEILTAWPLKHVKGETMKLVHSFAEHCVYFLHPPAALRTVSYYYRYGAVAFIEIFLSRRPIIYRNVQRNKHHSLNRI